MSETWAILTDIHGNIDALDAVLRDVELQGADKIVVLGDSVNYGAAAVAVIERITSIADIILLGNHEKAVLHGEEGMSGPAGAGLAWTREQLASCEAWQQLVDGAVFPDACERIVDDVHLVHASPRDPVLEYVWPGHSSYYLAFNDQIDQRLAQILAASQARHCFCGHTHVPAVLLPYAERRLLKLLPWDRRLSFVGPQAIFFVPDTTLRIEGLSESPVIINPGSVGQPRDGRPEAAYALYNGDELRFRRVPYNIDAAGEKIRALPIDDDARDYLADRLLRGE
ncbi:MAG: metallophosphoesterase family protein [Myxococcota bacterium]|nr:metallophosphoesterase family protein [Myxococcota bacterium]